MFKNKVKTIIITEYIEIYNMYRCILKECDTRKDVLHYKEALQKLKCKYELVLFKLKCFDLSFAILQKELNSIDWTKLKNSDTSDLYNKLDSKLKEYSNNLIKNMELLSFNDFEISFVKNFG